MTKRVRFLLHRLGERLWVKPLLMCLFSLLVVMAIGFTERLDIYAPVPDIGLDSVVSLLKILSSSMMVIATLAVASMVTSYNSASTFATPRAFPLVVADDLSQYALSVFISAFIFSVIALVAAQNGYYGKAGLFTLMVITLAVFFIVVVTFLRWVDGIARLGLLSNTVSKVESATAHSLCERARNPTMEGIDAVPVEGIEVCREDVGYVQLVDMSALQRIAEAESIRITLVSLPGRLIMPGRSLAIISSSGDDAERFAGDVEGSEGLDELCKNVAKAFVIGQERTFDEDPRFGFVALSQIACRAMSPAVNDPGTAVDIIASFVRLLKLWCNSSSAHERDLTEDECCYPGVAVPRIAIKDLFDDAFVAISRDAAANVEVAVRLQAAFASLASLDNSEIKEVVKKHAGLSLQRAEKSLQLDADIEAVRRSHEACIKLCR